MTPITASFGGDMLWNVVAKLLTIKPYFSCYMLSPKPVGDRRRRNHLNVIWANKQMPAFIINFFLIFFY